LKPERQNECGHVLKRRDILKLSLTAGFTLAASGISGVADVAGKEKDLDNRPEHARERFLKSMNCSQAILETYAPAMGMPVETARRVAAAFAGGMGMGSECGAVTGAFMVIGIKYGKTRDEDSRADKQTFKKLAEFVQEFKAKYKHIGCSELLETDMGTPEGVKEAADKGLFKARCPAYVKTAAELLENIIA
jgi:C_GCAxxG_C_C family probable redox protein